MDKEEKPIEHNYANELLERANVQAAELIEKAIKLSDELLEKANLQSKELIEKANAQAQELIKQANVTEKKLLKRANNTEKELLKKADAKEEGLLKEADLRAKALEKEKSAQENVLHSEESSEVADTKAKVLIDEAAVKAKDLVEVADEEAKDLVSDADYEAKNLINKAAFEAKDLVKEAAEQARGLVGEAANNTKVLIKEAAMQATTLIREAALTYIENKLRFLDIAAHELRTPVTSLSLMVQFAEKQKASGIAITDDFLKMIRPPLDRLLVLIVYLIDMSRLERKLVILSPVTTNLTSLIETCVKEFRTQFPKCQLHLKKPDHEIILNLDPVRIHQVLSNMIDNAIKYCGEGPVEVSIVAKERMVRVEILDSGPGISEERQKNLFTSFNRGNSDITMQTSGLGLGLAICLEIMKLHNGRVGATSSEKGGSCFYFELPY